MQEMLFAASLRRQEATAAAAAATTTTTTPPQNGTQQRTAELEQLVLLQTKQRSVDGEELQALRATIELQGAELQELARRARAHEEEARVGLQPQASSSHSSPREGEREAVAELRAVRAEHRAE